MPRATPLIRAYSAVTRVVLPVAAWAEKRKLDRAGMGARWREKLGHAGLARPEGQLIWFHAASVGESLTVLSLIERLCAALPRAHVLITSGTATSARLLAERLPERALHQFAPLDAPGPVRRFLRHWRPDAAVFAESELWPQTLWRCQTAGIPLALVNARLSARSLARWGRVPDSARAILSGFSLMLTQNAQMAQALVRLGADERRVVPGINLKSLAAPLPVKETLRAETEAALAGRPVWVAASTHEGEEETVLAAQAALLEAHPDLCLILAPRHPDRSAEVAALIAARGWPVLRRSEGALPAPGAPVYLADSLGELGTWYALSRIVFLGGSLRPIGGHNPFEVAQAGAAVISGAHVSNFAETFAGLEAVGGAVLVEGAEGLAGRVGTWLTDPAALDAACTAAEGFCAAQDGALDKITARLLTDLKLDRSRPFA